MGTARYCYNRAIDALNERPYKKGELRTAIVTNTKFPWEKETPQGIRENAVFEAYHAWSNGIKKYKKIGVPFDLKYRNKKARSQTIRLPVDAIRDQIPSLYPSILGKHSKLLISPEERQHIQLREKKIPVGKKRIVMIKEPNKKPRIVVEDNRLRKVVAKIMKHSPQIQYTQTGNWYILVPIDIQVSKSQADLRIVSIDQGVRTFVTTYSPSGEVLKIGDGDYHKLRRYALKLDSFISAIKNAKGIRKRRYRLAKLKKFQKIRNWIMDCHRKTVDHLVKNYDIIILPVFDSKKMCTKGKRKIGSKTVRSLLTWSYWKFREMLVNKAEEQGKKVVHPTEEWTSKTCTCCGKIDLNLGGKKEYKCRNCGIRMDRDINGARNICLKYLEEVNMWDKFWGDAQR